MPLGAYGLAFDGLDAPGLLPIEDGPSVTVRRVPEHGPPPPRRLDADVVVHHLLTGGWLEACRIDATATFHTPHEVSAADLVHPYLAPVGAIWAWWLGRVPFHGGGVVMDGAVWGVLGHKEAGKSTLLATLAEAGYAIATDDTLVVEPSSGDAPPTVHCGPRAIDLRPASAERFADSRLEPVRGGERFRLPVGPVAARLPLAGWLLLVEADEVAVERIAPADRLTALAPHRALLGMAPDANAWLDVASLPVLSLARPRRWDAVPDVVDAVGTVGGAPSDATIRAG